MLLHSLDDGNFPKDNDYTGSWKRFNPTAEIIHWSFEEAERLLGYEHPELLPVYHSKHMGVVGRSGILRFCILEKFGGCYMDKDIECLKSLREFEGKELVLQIGQTISPIYAGDYMMISKPNHPLWSAILGRKWARDNEPDEERTAATVWGATAILQAIHRNGIEFENVPLDKTFVRHHSKNTWKGKL